MGLITIKNFYNLERLKEGNGIIYILNNETLLKKTEESMLPFIRTLTKIKIDKVGLPTEIYRVVLSSRYLYSMPYFSNFCTLDNFSIYEKNFSDKEILLLFKTILEKIKEMHDKGLASGDMHAGNILIDENLDYRFIDFDFATTEKHVGNMVSCGPLFLENYDKKTLCSNYNTISQVQLSDKMNFLNMILWCMICGNFSKDRYLEKISDFSEYDMPESVQDKLSTIFSMKELPKKDDYFFEEIDTLIKTDYKLPYRKRI